MGVEGKRSIVDMKLIPTVLATREGRRGAQYRVLRIRRGSRRLLFRI